MDKILLFIPMYNCEKQIPRVIRRIAALGKDQGLFSCVLVVDNRSTDGSIPAALEAVKTLSCPAKVVRNLDNYSLGGSHKVAFRYALENGYDYVVVLHGDDQGDIADLVPLLKRGRHHGMDCLLGARFHRKSTLVNYSKFRIFGNHIFNGLVSLCTLHRVLDLGAGLNLYSTRWLKGEPYLPFPNNLTFNVYLLLYGIYSGARMSFFPLTWREEDQVSNAKLWRQTSEMLRLLARYLFARKELFAYKENQWTRPAYRFEEMKEGMV